MKKYRNSSILIAVVILSLLCLTGCGSKQQVHLYVNGDAQETVTVSEKTPLSVPDPIVPGYQFAGWYTQENADAVYNAAAEKGKDLDLYAGFTSIFKGGLTFRPESVTEENVVPEFAEMGEYGRIEAVAMAEDSVYLRAVGNYGIHLEESPTVTMGIQISSDAAIIGIWFLDSYAQTEGYPEKITTEYLSGTYEGEYAIPNLRVKPVTGASYTSEGVLYAVRTAAYYVSHVYGYVSETTVRDLEEMSTVFPAEYTAVSSVDVDISEKIGTVLFAAEGITENEKHVLAMKVESSQNFNYDGAYRSPYDSSKPNPFVMIIIADLDSREILAYQMVIDGTNCEYFMIPQERFDAYLGAVIAYPEVFDTFTDGLVQNYDGDWEFSVDDYNRKTITGTSIIYTGATVDGTFSSQLLRNCYRAAARYFCTFIT